MVSTFTKTFIRASCFGRTYDVVSALTLLLLSFLFGFSQKSECDGYRVLGGTAEKRAAHSALTLAEARSLSLTRPTQLNRSSPSQRRSTQKQTASKPQSIAPAALAATPNPAFFAGAQPDFNPNLLQHPSLTPAAPVPQTLAATPQRPSTAGTKRKAAALSAAAAAPAMDPFIQPKLEASIAPAPDPSSSGRGPARPETAGSALVESQQQPPAQKIRTNTALTPAEEKRLKQMRDLGSTWSDIAKVRPAITHSPCFSLSFYRSCLNAL